MNEFENRLLQGCSVFKGDSINSEEIGCFIYKNYIVSVYKLSNILDDKEEGAFENVYAIYDLDNDEVFDEYTESKRELFEELPQIDDVLFNYSFDSREIVEKAKKVIKEDIIKYYNDRVIDESYVEALKRVYDFIDESSKEFYMFFINAVKKD